ncbi:acetyltransferase [Arthrobacter sp. PGP41]|uniref:acetyltransferase n=1 Tax=Arthrobacter sp. PGP41 TaxID=2079227 RepID=UPI000CDC117A|nr:acetyltransferase [Arthrobacter sp. PGP41]AUZ35717.1 acetyltransferase [Arthrobacter sp. PGP41]
MCRGFSLPTIAPIVLIGAGGFGRETIEALKAESEATGRPTRLVGVVDSRPTEFKLQRLKSLDVPFLGTEEAWLATRPTEEFVVGIGDPAIRAQAHGRLTAAGLRPGIVIHPSAGIGSNCRIDPGTVVCAGAQVSSFVTLGLHSHVNPHSTIGHDAVLEEFVSVNPGAVLSGMVHCCTRVLIGAGATVLQGLTIGAAATVGAMACVTRDVPPEKVAVGVPARWSEG